MANVNSEFTLMGQKLASTKTLSLEKEDEKQSLLSHLLADRKFL